MAEPAEGGEEPSAAELRELAKQAEYLPGPAGVMLTAAAEMTGQMERFEADMGRVKALASDKQFAVDEETGKAMIKAVETYLAKWFAIRRKAEQLKQGLPLGSDPYAKQVTAYTAEVATDALGKMELFEKSLEAFVESLRIARANYAKMEDHAIQQFKTEKAD